VDVSGRIDELNRLKLGDYPGLYSTLEPPSIDSLSGYYRGSILGPKWFRSVSDLLLAITGLGGWWGKHFEENDHAINLVERGAGLQRRMPVKLVQVSSVVDNKPTLALQYIPDNPFPWPYVVDELRLIEPGILLGMMYVKIGLLRRLVSPFLLEFEEQVDGL
jgi:hypothetical protein